MLETKNHRWFMLRIVEVPNLDVKSRYVVETATLYVRPKLGVIDEWLAIVSVRRALRSDNRVAA